MTQVFSFHTFAGMLGSAIAPATLLFMQSTGGLARRISRRGAARRRRGTLSGGAGRAAGRASGASRRSHAAKRRRAPTDGWRLLLSPPILLNLVFFIVLSMVGGGLNQYLVVALGALLRHAACARQYRAHRASAMSALGVLLGGVLAGAHRAPQPRGVRRIVGDGQCQRVHRLVDPGALLLVLVAVAERFASGMTMPSRDMIVREVTPPGSFGKVFGFVTTGFHIGGIVAPLIFGAVSRPWLAARGVPLHRRLRAGGHRHRGIRHVGPAHGVSGVCRYNRATRRDNATVARHRVAPTLGAGPFALGKPTQMS